MTSEGKEKKKKKQEITRGRDKEREGERVVTTRTTWPFIEARRRVSRGNSIISRLMDVNFCTFPLAIRGDNVSSVFPFLTTSCERNGTVWSEARPLLLPPRLGSIHHRAGTEKRSCLFQVRGRYLLRQLQRPSTSVWGFTWRAPLCVDLFIKNQNVRERME